MHLARNFVLHCVYVMCAGRGGRLLLHYVYAALSQSAIGSAYKSAVVISLLLQCPTLNNFQSCEALLYDSAFSTLKVDWLAKKVLSHFPKKGVVRLK